ncbi:Arc family DNA-binding protein [Winslowiella toletana]|uniref:Arc family DNA-binding protein n=1 Tax=Winslowiella toletana TaxID=92490 RepID=UPI0028BE4B4D|nr:Arc family DNA-binding protein [Winslowiella toletana]WNN42780.1 Arc family DNA-binding protein [Winslowiella toletana]
MTKYPSQMQDKFNLRFPDGMRDEIADRAKANGRSMNSEIIEMIKFAMEKRPSWVAEDEIFIDAPGGIGSESSRKKYPDKKPGLLLREIQTKIDELTEIMKNSTSKEEVDERISKKPT